MKIQTLNKTQEKKLRELIKQFFPELHSFEVNGYYGDFMVILNKYTNKKTTCEGFYKTKIHWYQLCLTELPKRIWNKLDNDYQSKIGNFWFKSTKTSSMFLFYPEQILVAEMLTKWNFVKLKHPVDFLYDFVKKCKKNKYFK